MIFPYTVNDDTEENTRSRVIAEGGDFLPEKLPHDPEDPSIPF